MFSVILLYKNVAESECEAEVVIFQEHITHWHKTRVHKIHTQLQSYTFSAEGCMPTMLFANIAVNVRE